MYFYSVITSREWAFPRARAIGSHVPGNKDGPSKTMPRTHLAALMTLFLQVKAKDKLRDIYLRVESKMF